MMYNLQDIANVTGGEFQGAERIVSHVNTDSRTLIDVESTLFVAIRGTYHDGHTFVNDLYERGVRAFVVDREIEIKRYPEAGFIVCDNSLDTLQAFAAHHRKSLKGKVVAITGSNGKTVTKEWIAQLCPEGVTLFRSPKSYNSQLGVALSLLMTTGNEDIILIEAGISKPGEMRRLEKIIMPDIGIFTTLGDAHQENFLSVSEKLEQKLALFANCESIIFNGNYDMVKEAVERMFSDKNLINVTSSRYDTSALQFKDSASKENVCEALALYELLGYDLRMIMAKIPSLQGVAMRLELKEGINGSKIINDSYNSDINSLSLALDYLSTVSANRPRVLILSDIAQSGMSSEELYSQVADLVRSRGITTLIGIGEQISRHAHLFNCESSFFPSTDNFIKGYNRSNFSHKSILIKGGRQFSFEKISRILEEKSHTTVLEVDLDNMIHNLNFFRTHLGPEVKTMAMVKALSYGSGTFEVANMLQNQRVNYLAVAFADEGVTLRESGITMPIVVLNADADSFSLMIDYNLEPEIYSMFSLQTFTEELRRHGETQYKIHIKLDTGMHRLGFTESDIDQLIETLKHEKSITVSSIFSHLATSDESKHDSFTLLQIELFERLSSRICTALLDFKIMRHICNSAGIERFPQAQFDMVRLGIGLYGIAVEHQADLLPCSKLRSRIVQIKELNAGDTVGYGRHGKITAQTRIATVPIGYADGLDRHLGRGAWSMIVNGVKVPTIGNICMDTCMLDVTEVECREGDNVTIFGEGVSIIEMAKVLDTIPYEILTSVSARVKRIYIKE